MTSIPLIRHLFACRRPLLLRVLRVQALWGRSRKRRRVVARSVALPRQRRRLLQVVRLQGCAWVRSVLEVHVEEQLELGPTEGRVLEPEPERDPEGASCLLRRLVLELLVATKEPVLDERIVEVDLLEEARQVLLVAALQELRRQMQAEWGRF